MIIGRISKLTYDKFLELVFSGELRQFQDYNNRINHHWKWYLVGKEIEGIANNPLWKRYPFIVWSPFKDSSYEDQYSFKILECCLHRNDEIISPIFQKGWNKFVSLEDFLEEITPEARSEILFNLDLFR